MSSWIPAVTPWLPSQGGSRHGMLMIGSTGGRGRGNHVARPGLLLESDDRWVRTCLIDVLNRLVDFRRPHAGAIARRGLGSYVKTAQAALQADVVHVEIPPLVGWYGLHHRRPRSELGVDGHGRRLAPRRRGGARERVKRLNTGEAKVGWRSGGVRNGRRGVEPRGLAQDSVQLVTAVWVPGPPPPRLLAGAGDGLSTRREPGRRRSSRRRNHVRALRRKCPGVGAVHKREPNGGAACRLTLRDLRKLERAAA